MAINIKALGQGKVAVSVAAIYTTPASTQTIIKKVTMVNTAASSRSVNLYVNSAGTNRSVIPKDLPLGAGESLETGDFTLEAGDTLQAVSTVDGASVDYTVNGIEES